MENDLFVLKGLQGAKIHTFFRASAIVMGYLVYREGDKYDSNILRAIGGVTMLVDSFTLYKSIKKISNNSI